MKTHLIPSRNGTPDRPYTSHMNFDLELYVREILSPEVAATIASGVAWIIDTTCINAARQLFKAAAELHSMNSIDATAELISSLKEQAFAEQCFAGMGSAAIGPVLTIQELMYQRDIWHALAGELVPLTFDWSKPPQPRVYAPRDLEDQIHNPRQQVATELTKYRLKKDAVGMAEAMGVPEGADSLYQDNLLKHDLDKSRLVTNLKRQSQGVSFMLHAAQHFPHEGITCDVNENFDSLTLSSQRLLINTAINKAIQAGTDAAKNSNLNDSEYSLISLTKFKVMKELNEVLRSPRFTHAKHQETAGELATG